MPKLKDSSSADSSDLQNEATDCDLTENYILRLYIAGSSIISMQAIESIKNICENHLQGKYELQVIDLFQQPQLARGEQIIAAPTLVKKLPLPLRRMIGDMLNTERVLVGLDLRKKTS